MKEQFEDKRYENRYLHNSTLETIGQANKIIAEYSAQGYRLSLRQLYYRFVAKNLFPNSERSYKRLSQVLTTGRVWGLVDWDAIEDRVRFLQSFGDNGSPEDVAGGMGFGYREDLWKDQDNYVEVWIEKDAISNVVERACSEWRVPFFACRGYASITEAYNAGQRLAAKRDEGKNVVILHIGDHDPSGMDMTRDNEYRLGMFMRDETFKLHRIALNKPQIEQFNPPPQPSKKTDSREAGYRALHGENSWEVDALEPSVIEDVVSTALEPLVNKERFERARACEELAARELKYVGSNYERARNLLLGQTMTTPKLAVLLWERQEGKCCYCNVEMTKYVAPSKHRATDATIEHLMPRSRGGSEEVSNKKLSCHRCNTCKGNMTHEEFWFLAGQCGSLEFMLYCIEWARYIFKRRNTNARFFNAGKFDANFYDFTGYDNGH